MSNFFAYDQQKMFLKFFKNIVQQIFCACQAMFSDEPKGQTLLVKQTANVLPTMFDRVARA